MNSQAHLKEIFLLGTEKRSLDPLQLPAALQEALSSAQDSAESERVLEAISLFHYYQEAGTGLPSLGKVPAQVPIVEEKAFVNAKLAMALRKLLRLEPLFKRDALLALWIKEVSRRGQIVGLAETVSYFNALLEVPKAIKQLAPPTFGKRSTWLIRQEARYQDLLPAEEAQDNPWEFGTKKQREAYIRPLLHEKPTMALELIQGTWEQENARSKLWILQLLQQRFQPEFQDFWESLYEGEFKHKTKESKTAKASRAILASCLLMCEGSALQTQTLNQLKTYLNPLPTGIVAKIMSAGKNLLRIPETPDEFFDAESFMIHYGIDLTDTQAANFRSNQHYAFSKLVAALPFSAWMSILPVKYTELVNFFLKDAQFSRVVKGERSPLLTEALLALGIATQDSELLLALIPHLQQPEHLKRVLPLLTPRSWEQVMLQHSDWMLSDLVNTCPLAHGQYWSTSFASQLLSTVKNELASGKMIYDYNIAKPYLTFLPLAAQPVLEKLNQSFDPYHKMHSFWGKYLYHPISQALHIRAIIEQA